jgi:hypothetical protein
MGAIRRSDLSTSTTGHAPYARTQSLEATPMRTLTTRRKTSLVERVRTFVDRTLDAAFGRFDH